MFLYHNYKHILLARFAKFSISHETRLTTIKQKRKNN